MSKKSKPNMCLENMTFCLTGAMSMGTRKQVWLKIQAHGGNVAATVTGGVTHLVASEGEYIGETNKVVTAKAKGTMIVTEEFLSACMEAGKKVDEGPYLLSKGSDGGESMKNKKKNSIKVEKYEGQDDDDAEMSDEGGNKHKPKKHKPGKLQYVKKGKSAVDPYCSKSLVKDGHVLEEGDEIYSTMLNQTDISAGVKGTNKYYVLQLIEHDNKNKYWVWSRWGRVGVVGQRRLQEYNNKDAAKSEFFKKFKAKTGNNWDDRESATNKVGKYNVVEIDYGSEEDADEKKETAGSDEEKKYKHKKPKKYEPSPYNTSDDDMSTEEDVPENKKNKAKGKEKIKDEPKDDDVKMKEEKDEDDDVPKKSKYQNNNNNKNSDSENDTKPSNGNKHNNNNNNNNNKNANNNNNNNKNKNKKGDESDLHPRLQEFIKLICDVKMMKQELLNMDIDLKRMPLGKLNKKQIKKGYSVLKEINDLIKNGAKKEEFIHQSNLFYTLIPHNFGFQKPPIIDNKAMLQAKMTLLETMTDIQIAHTLMQEDIGEDSPIDSQYKSLKADMEPLDPNSDEYSAIAKYVENTHGPTHQEYRLEIEDIFTVNREPEEDAFVPNKKDKNRMLLWHGSRLTNFVGILSQGLRIAPPEAPSTGYMFGKGVYFADMVTKSANYCHTSAKNSTGCLILSEVALGDAYEMYKAQYFDKPPSGFQSVQGVGKWVPDPKDHQVMSDGMIIPTGEPIDNPDTTPTVLNYNEFIVYDTAQVKMRYVLRLKFNYGGTSSSSSSSKTATKKSSSSSSSTTTTTTSSSPPSSPPSSSSSSSSKKGIWQYKVGQGWSNYSDADSTEIQTNKEKGINVFQLVIQGKKYTVDLDQEQQYQSNDPSKARQIRFSKKK